MPKQISFDHNYTHAMFADFLQQEQYPMLIFFESKKISIDNVFEFRCTSTLSNMLKQNIINSNAGSILVSEQLKDFLLSVLPVDGVQFIESSLTCKDGKIDKLYLINSLLTENIIDIEASEKRFFSFAPNEFVLESSGIKYNENIMLSPNIARHNNQLYNTDLFFSDSLVELIKKNNYDRYVVFS